jgi:hypothetical protein
MRTKLFFISMTAFLLSSLFSYGQYTACWQAEDIEIPAGSAWRKSTTNAGFTGSGYIEWTGGDNFSQPTDPKNILTYTFTVAEAGTYQVYVRGRRDYNYCGCPANAKDDACNDIFGKMDNTKYIKNYGERYMGTVDLVKQLRICTWPICFDL